VKHGTGENIMYGHDIYFEPDGMLYRNPLTYIRKTEPEAFRMHLTEDEQHGFCAYARRVEVKKKQILYCQGEQHSRVYMPVHGAVKITRYTTDGRDHIVDIVGKRGLFGCVPGMFWSDTTVVVEDGLVVVLNGYGYERLEEREPHLAARVRSVIDLRRHRIENALIDLLSSTVEQRLARTFLRLLDDFCEPRHKGFLITVALTHNDFADLIASTRETVTMKLNKFIKDGLIEYEGRDIVVRSIGEMQRVAGL
jgi:CRP-like cAMP-binding protein